MIKCMMIRYIFVVPLPLLSIHNLIFKTNKEIHYMNPKTISKIESIIWNGAYLFLQIAFCACILTFVIWGLSNIIWVMFSGL